MSKLSKLCLLLLLFMFPWVIYAAPIKLNAIHIQEDNEITHLSFNVTQPVKYRVFSLSHPKRIIIDFENTHLSLNLQQIFLTTNRIVKIREGYPKLGTLRIVLDVKENVSYNVKIKPNSPQVKIDLLSAQNNIFKKNMMVPLDNILSSIVKPFRTKPTIIMIDPGHAG